MEWNSNSRFVYAADVNGYITISKHLEHFIRCKRGQTSSSDWWASYAGKLSMFKIYLSMEEPDRDCPRDCGDMTSCDGCNEVKERCATWMRRYATNQEYEANKDGFVPF